MNCNATSSCTACPDGQILKDKQCFKCTYTNQNCITCTSEDLATCAKCEEGFFLSDEKTCVKCTEPCFSCVKSNVCLDCINGFYLAQT